MIIEYVILTLFGIGLLGACLRLLRVETDRTLRFWVLGWASLITTSILGSFFEGYGSGGMALPIFVAYCAASAMSVFMLAGSFALLGRVLPKRAITAVSTLIVVRALIGVAGATDIAELLSIPIEVGANALAASVLWRAAARAEDPRTLRILATAHVLLASAEALVVVSHFNGTILVGATATYLAAALILGAAQIMALVTSGRARVRDEVRARSRDLGLMNEIAHLATRFTHPRELVQNATPLLQEHFHNEWIAVWGFVASRQRLVESEVERAPESARRAFAEIELGAADVRFDRAAELCSDQTDDCQIFVPLEWQGNLLGILGLGHAAGDAPPRDLLDPIVSELSLALEHVVSIQQRDRANLALLRERLMMKAVFETAPMGLLIAAENQNIELMNRTGSEHMGFGDPEGWIGRKVGDFLTHLRDRCDLTDDDVQGAVEMLESTGMLRDFEVSVREPTPKTLLLFSSRVHDEDGQLMARIWASRDVTEERALEDKLRHAQKLETLGTLSGGLAHDFNNQLAVILGNVRYAKDAMASGCGEDADVRESLEDLERAADYCAQLTRSLLSFARRAPVELGAVAPARLIEDLRDLLRPLVPDRVRLTYSVDSDLPMLMADPLQLQQALVNLALNACDAIEAEGQIDIGVQACNVDAVRVRTQGIGQSGLHLEISVRDTGAGMARGEAQHIFEPFYTTKDVGSGTGLGLAIVHGVVTAHSGWVEVDSQPGAGTHFRLYLPVTNGSLAVSEAHESIALEAAADATDFVLVADDEQAVRRVVRRALEREGFRVEEAIDGEGAVKQFQEDPERFSAVLLDVGMPGMGGAAARDEILAIRPDITVLLASGAPDADPDRQSDVIAKPFDLDRLTRRLRGVDDSGAESTPDAPTPHPD